MSTALDAYLKREGISDAEFAPAIDRDRSTVSRLRRGVVKPDIELAAQIEDVTGGAVPIKSWLSAEGAPPFPNPPHGADLPARLQTNPTTEKPVGKLPVSSTKSATSSSACESASTKTDRVAA